MRYLGVARDSRYSPNMTSADAFILSSVLQGLRDRGIEADCVPECQLPNINLSGYNAIVTMARDTANLSKFTTSLPCFNSTEGILTCQNKCAVATTFTRVGIPQPEYTEATGHPNGADFFPVWVKNSDTCAQERADTAYAANAEELHRAEEALARRGIKHWLLQHHAEGDLVKFYGVEGTPFLRWLYPDPNHSKHGHEAMNGEAKGYPFNSAELKDIADSAARALRVPIYGGDCIVDRCGHIRIIDFNDWPSYYCCQEEATSAIVRRVTLHSIDQ